MAKKRKPVQSVNKMKPRGADDRGVLHSFKLGGGENAKADYDSMIDDGYHAMDDEGMAKKAYKNLKGTGMNPPSPGDVQNALRKKVGEDEYEGKPSPIRMYSKPLKYVSPGMTPEATGSGFKMSMGSKENFSESNFSSKDQSTMSQAPSIMKDDFGGETVEMKDQGSPLNYGVRDNVKKERKMTGAENQQAGKDKRSEQKRQYLKDAMAVAQTAGSIAGAVASDRRLKKDIKLISVSPTGINIYNFKYKDTNHGVGEFQGVMSDDIPYGAIVSHEDGFDRVDYSKLDVEFKAL
jgi:hypothetical protein